MFDADLTYDFLAPRQIVFGWGQRGEVGKLGRQLGDRAWVLCGSRTLAANGVLGQIHDALDAESIEAIDVETLSHEPEVADVDRVAGEIRRRGIRPGDFVLAIGGGAAIDLGKAAAAMATNTQSPAVKDYLEGVGRGLTLTEAPLPVLAMPTTAGTGAEATKNAVISSYDPPFKKSLRDRRLVPQIALVDPELSVSVPPPITAASGMDAITQLFESYISRKARPIPRALAVQGLRLAVASIAEAVREPTSRLARERMAHAALLSGMCLANSGLGMAHGVAAALGVHCRAPHGAACAVMLPTALRVNQYACQKDLSSLAHLLYRQGRDTTSPRRAIGIMIERIERLCDEVGVPRRLSELGVTREQIPAIVASSRGSSMSGSPVQLSDQDLTDHLEAIL
ncbi:MAG: iron-containing alcohol dehydrogenase [Planctomycetia bacterium]|nr:iron-containing alcohol dehydrogenase [Planctomycetia bacterium]